MFRKNTCLNPSCSKKAERGQLFCGECSAEEDMEAKSQPSDSQGPRDHLPEEMTEDSVVRMRDGEEGYVVPWAMFANPQRRLFIVGTYTVHVKPGGTVQMKIKKQGETILVDRKTIRGEKYSPGMPCYMGVSKKDYLPVQLIEGW